MSGADMYGLHQSGAGPRVRDLLRRCGMTHDHAERAALLARIAYELDQAADEISTAQSGTHSRELVAALHGQASMARFVADLERSDRVRQVC